MLDELNGSPFYVVARLSVLISLPMTTATQIRAQLDRILASKAFDGAERAKSFLTFVVTTALEGRSEDIKESVIAVEALARSTDFDPKTDPIVRVEAGRLRSRFKTFYEAEGLNDH